ncbi:MAG: squalene synthase HpnC [Planctomycetaceae bacterium]
MSSAFQLELERWGPDAVRGKSATSDEAAAYCRDLANSHYENFPIVTWLLPRSLHQHFYNVYAFCRWADDLGDEVGDCERSLQLLGWWREELRACYAGETRHPVFVALKETINRFEIPMEPLDDLISAFEQDQTVRDYGTFAQLHDYCRRSADPVGRIVLRLCRQYSGDNVPMSDSICTGLQLANFWQDVARDADIGRVYLPREDRQRFGYTDTDLKSRTTNDAFLKLMRFEVGRARQFLLDGLPLVDCMPGRLRIDIDLFARGGLLVLDRIAAVGYRVWETRPVLKRRHFFGLFLKSLFRSAWPRRRAKPHPQRETSRTTDP